MLATSGPYSVSTVAIGPSILETEVVLAIRPQLIDLTTDTPNTLECAVEDVIQRPGRGTQVLLTLQRESGATTELQLKTDERVDVTAETATIGWEPADSRLLETVSVVEDVDLENDILGE